MNDKHPLIIGDWRIDPDIGQMSRGDEQITIRPREMDLLIHLATRSGEVVTTEEIIENVWKDVVVANDSVYFSVSQLRKALGDNTQKPRYIETIPKRGYRLIAAISQPDAEAATQPPFLKSSEAMEPTSKRRARLISVLAFVVIVLIIAGLYPIFTEQPFAEVPDRSIAVMPFVDLSPDGDQEYFADGISEELLNRLSSVAGLRVAARTSSFSFKGRELSIPEIGELLGVATILEGSVRKDGDQVRIAAQLIDAKSGFQLWTQTYERELRSIFAVQEEISRSIVEALQPEFTDSVSPLVASTSRTVDPLAYDHYLHGLEAFRVNSFEVLRRAVVHFETVIRLDPTFAEAYAELARTKFFLLLTGAEIDRRILDEVEELANKTLDLNPESARAYAVLGSLYLNKGELEQGKQYFKKAHELSPNDSSIMAELAACNLASGDIDSVSELLEKALRTDPLNFEVLAAYAHLQHMKGNLTEALRNYEKAAEIIPSNPSVRWFIGRQHVETGDLVSGIEHFRMATRLDPADHELAAFLAITYANVGMFNEAEAWVTKSVEIEPRSALAWAAQAVWQFNTNQRQQALDTATRVLDEENIYFSHGAREILTSIATNELVAVGNFETAERLLLRAYPEAAALSGNTGPISRREIALGAYEHEAGLRMGGHARNWVLALADIYRKTERQTQTQNAIAFARNGDLAHAMQIRDKPLNKDLLNEAGIRALEGDTDGAYAMIEQAINNGFRLNWRIEVADNPVFSELRNQSRFTILMDRLQSDLDTQHQQLISEST